MKECAYILYGVSNDGVTTITLNRPERMNAFNRKMSGELVLALDRFAHTDDEKVLVLTGAGNAFSTGEDLKNINLAASDLEMRKYAEEALRDYHNIVRSILLIAKPIVALINGVAAGAGLSIALACDYRVALRPERYLESFHDKNILIPAFASMGLIADSGMTATLARLIGHQRSKMWCEYPGYGARVDTAETIGLLDNIPGHMFDFRGSPHERVFNFVKSLTLISPMAFSLSKKNRNSALIYELNKRVFPWELRAQTACLESNYFKERARAFLGKSKKEAS